jgi:multidrug efflux pump subunit AcrA (membrane-fusion protein)
MSSEDDVHCDSLSGTALGASALTVPPSPRFPRAKRHARFVPWLMMGLALGAAGLCALTRGAANQAPTEALHVDGRTVSYSGGFAARAGIRTIEIHDGPFLPVVSVAGKAGFDPERVAVICANALGTVRRVAKYEGESVRRGEVLAEIGSASQAKREAALALRSDHELTPRTLGRSLLRSPLDGTVVERRIITGQPVRGESQLFVIANLDRLLVDVSLDRSQASGLQVGDRVELSREAALGVRGTGSVLEIESLPATDAGSPVRLHIGVDNRGRGLRAGEAVVARIFAGHAGRALLVPNRALAWVGGQPWVFVAASAHSATAALVTVGGSDGEQTEVRVGLASGQRVVSDGAHVLKEASFF